MLEEAGLVVTERRGRSKFHYFTPAAARRDHRAVAHEKEDRTMRIELTSVFVDDQRAALAFYTDVLGFTKRPRHPARRGLLAHRGLAGIADGPELLLEPSNHPAVKPYRDALVGRRHPARSVRRRRHRRRARPADRAGRGVHPAADRHRHGVVAVFDDTCGNLIQLIEAKPDENHDDAR